MRGFSLLEVMVSLAILALALTAIAGVNATAFDESNYAKQVTTATLLARSKMIDIEEKLRKDGFGSDDKEFSGDFEEGGYPGMKWTATCRQVDVDIAQLVGGLFGGDISSDTLPEQMQSFLGALQGTGPSDLKDKVAGSDISKMLGGGGLEMIFKQVGDTLGKSIREITLEISWGKKGVDQETIKFIEYVTTSGRLTMPQNTLPQIPGITGPAGNPSSNPPPTPGNPGGAVPGGAPGGTGISNPILRGPNTLVPPGRIQ